MNKLSKLVEEFEKNSQEQSKSIETQLTKDFRRHESVINAALQESENSILAGINTQTSFQLALLKEQSKAMKKISDNIQLSAHAESVENALKTNESILLKAVQDQNRRFNMLILKTWTLVPVLAMFITLILAAMSWHYTNQIMETKANLADVQVKSVTQDGKSYLVLLDGSTLIREGKNKENQEVWMLYQRK